MTDETIGAAGWGCIGFSETGTGKVPHPAMNAREKSTVKVRIPMRERSEPRWVRATRRSYYRPVARYLSIKFIILPGPREPTLGASPLFFSRRSVVKQPREKGDHGTYPKREHAKNDSAYKKGKFHENRASS